MKLWIKPCLYYSLIFPFLIYMHENQQVTIFCYQNLNFDIPARFVVVQNRQKVSNKKFRQNL